MTGLSLDVRCEEWPLRQPFRITGKTWYHSACVLVTLTDGVHRGRGEAQGVSYLGEDVASMQAQIEAVRGDIERGIERQELQELLPRGGARNAIDCALWDLEAKRRGQSIWQRLGMTPGRVTTVFTIGLEATPAAMGEKAARTAGFPVLKVKLNEDRPVERLEAIRAARPDARIVVDANQGWTFEQLQEVLPRCATLDIDMIEQPLPRDGDEALEGFASPVLLAADESCQDRTELESAARRYGMINIKLDKTGGLTEALALAHAARERGLRLMVGNMLGTSLAMAPSFVVAQLCDFVDIDGPLLLAEDREHGLQYDGGEVEIFAPGLWG